MTVLAEYGQRENTPLIQGVGISQYTVNLSHISPYPSFIYPSWISNERPGLLFDLATGWLMQHRIILPEPLR
ncbi:hypothetical protein [Escherichia coli]|uniref:hypothetical protein n=1 Tax=Escherichia coli TaxID=562 RepID=UPI00388EF0CA